jgi:hypothetical protein
MRRSMQVLVTVALFALGAIVGAEAQTPSSDLVGERIRVTVRSGGPAAGDGRVLVGRLMSIDQDRLVIAGDPGAPAEITLASVERLELTMGQHRNMRRGFLIGGGLGALAGGVLGAIEGSKCEGTLICFGAGGGAVLGAGALGGLGGALGLGIGAAVTTERWSEVSSQRWGLTVRPGRGGVAEGGVVLGFRLAL